MRSPIQLGQLIIVPFVTIGVLAAVLTWEIEHVGSVVLAVAIAAGSIIVGVVAAIRLRRDFDSVAEHYKVMLKIADEQTRETEAAVRTKDEFLAVLSHELRTPLNSVLGWSRLLGTGKLDSARAARAIAAIERAGWAQSHLIDDLLDMSRIVAGTFQIVPRDTRVQLIVQEAVDALRPAADAKQIALDVRLDPTIGLVIVDPDRFRQVAWNLISNAIKFTPNGGQVVVSLVMQPFELCLTVHDSGSGFTPETAARLFQRFRQGDGSSTREHGGLGLGLSIVRHVVELHGGTVIAESPGLNGGAMFEVRLPIRTSAATPAPQSPDDDLTDLQ